ncbi:sugar phosphate isomerase/epimerase [Paraflavitalea sp. CAU 1676]|uniref:sugar phosphate isomerase/epimerase family protein n=1 Tax=Paraflavitalea sp. CAU 1676 TaxID=3032598 RepID=UPI0023DAA5D3|nr:sugar phosphate isomerase/epimerase [Paraflavitalea sp. CAU 1676]MDF2189873.1 sugar phosphate isomerase/epimerase [Paraflavitalea sp. CAU 1676]
MKRLLLIPFLFLSILVAAQSASNDMLLPDSLGWRLGSQAYTFRLFSLEEALGKMKSIGIKYVELFPGQKITKQGTATTAPNATPEDRALIKKLLKDNGIKAVCYGVVNGKNEEEWKAVFEFAKDIGIEHITTEPPFNQLELLDKFCNEYKIRAALHNHPVPTTYWHPAIVLDQLKNRSNMIGVCGDIGHWVRSALDPVASIKELKGRLIAFHVKDLHVYGSKSAHDVPWGTGVSNIAGVLNELKAQGFKGYFSVEYEYQWENNLPAVQESTQYFMRVAKRINAGN